MLLTTCTANLLHLLLLQYSQNWLLFYKLSEFYRPHLFETIRLTKPTLTMQVGEVKTVVQLFIARFIVIIVARKVITPQFVASQLLVGYSVR